MPAPLECLYGRGDCSPDRQEHNRRLDTQGKPACVHCNKIGPFNPVLRDGRTHSQRAADVAASDIRDAQMRERGFTRGGS